MTEETKEELFISIINDLKKQREIDRNYCVNIEKTFGIEFYDGYNNDILWKSMVNILHVLTNTIHDRDSNINYFIDELDFGNDYKEGSITEITGEIIDFSTAEKLYEYLTK